MSGLGKVATKKCKPGLLRVYHDFPAALCDTIKQQMLMNTTLDHASRIDMNRAKLNKHGQTELHMNNRTEQMHKIHAKTSSIRWQVSMCESFGRMPPHSAQA